MDMKFFTVSFFYSISNGVKIKNKIGRSINICSYHKYKFIYAILAF